MALGAADANGGANGAVVGAYSASNSLSGYALGGGLGWAMWDRWSPKLEYLYMSFPSYTNTYATAPAVFINYSRLNENVVRLGLNYHL
jgi:outer membrane immunogenic protein